MIPRLLSRIKRDYHIWSLLWLLPSNRAILPHLIFAVIATIESSNIATSDLCCDCYYWIEQYCHIWSLLWLLPSNRAILPHLIAVIATIESSNIATSDLCRDCYHWIEQYCHIWSLLWLLPSNRAILPHLVFCCERFPDYLKARLPHLVFAVIATIESSNIATSDLCCEWFHDYHHRIEQDFHIWSLLWKICSFLTSNQARFPHLVCCERFPGFYL